MRPRPHVFRSIVIGLGLLGLATPGSALARPRPSPTPVTVTQTSLTPSSTTSTVSTTGTLKLTASGSVTAKSVGIAVRDAAGVQYDFPGAAVNVSLNTTTYTYTSAARTFAPGTYTEFGFWQDSAGAYHSLPAVTLTVTQDGTVAPPPPPPPPPPPSIDPSAGPVGIPGTWTLKKADEFNGTALDTTIWRPGWFSSTVSSPVNPDGESACYNANNVTFPGDGAVHLKITAAASTCAGVTRPYTGAMLSSNYADGRASGGYEYAYGALEARVYLPAYGGTKVANWPAVWTDGHSWPSQGENDVLEGLGGDACWHFHSSAGGPGGCAAGNFSGWHTFASDWAPGSVTYYYDGIKVGTITTGITSYAHFLLLTNTVSSWPGATTVAPADMQVDYIRIWQH
ncbi:MAG: hypothetical protein QOJ89_846 [bacterium]|jgi:hypothetical protein